MFKLFKIYFLFLIAFSIQPGYSQSSSIGPAVEVVEMEPKQVITKKVYNTFFKSVLVGDAYKRPVLESFDSGKKSLNLKEAIRDQRKKMRQSYSIARKGLKEVLRTLNISDKQTLNRILSDFYSEMSFEERISIQEDWKSEDLQRNESARKYFLDFMNAVEYRYGISHSDSSKRKAINLFHEILKSEDIGRKEIRLFRKVLSKLGLPPQAHHDEFLKVYLLEMKEHQKSMEFAEESSQRKIIDEKILTLIQKTKVYFDDQHFRNLQTMTKFTNIIKGFPMQYILFQAAIGSMLYRESITDPLLYGAVTKPGQLQEFASQSLTPSAVISFFIFIVISQKHTLHQYKIGRHFDNKFLKTTAPYAGLALGFFISSLAMELYQDADFRQCLGSFVSKEKENGISEEDKHISSCEASYTKWIQSKWSDYAVDIVTLLGASWVSHKIVQTLLMGIRATPHGGSLLSQLSKKVGPRVMGWAGFLVTIYVFMESHHWLDKFIGKSVKEYLKVNSIQTNLLKLNHMQDLIQNPDQVSDYFQDKLSSNDADEMGNLKEVIIEKIKLIGRQFNNWSLLKGQDYQWFFSLWLRKTNKVTLFYQQSRELLTNLYNQSTNSYDFNIGVMSQNQLPQNKGFLIDKNAFDENRDHYINTICSDSAIHQVEIYYIKWKEFCENQENVNLTDEDLVYLAYDATVIISEWLDVSDVSDVDALSYLGEKPEELLSSNPNYSLKDLNLTEKINLARSLLKVIYYSEDSVEFKTLFDNNYKNICLEKYSTVEEIESCQVDSYFQLRDKILALAIYILKKEFDNPYALMPASGRSDLDDLTPSRIINLKNALGDKVFQKIEILLAFLKVYQKGEIFFNFDIENYQAFKKEAGRIGDQSEVEKIKKYPYLFFKSLICNLKGDSLEGQFVAPHLFKDLSYLCEKIDSVKTDSVVFYPVIHSFIFSEPVEFQSEKYSSLWLLLEKYVRDRFKSSEDLLEFFEEKSEKQIEELSSEHLEDLNHLNNNYLFPNMVNPEVRNLKFCEEITSYYSEENLKSVELKSLEVSLFQIIYWINRLEKQYGVLSSKCEIIEMLKGYHDTYIRNSSPYIYVPQDSAELDEKILEKGLSSIKELYPNINIPVLVKPEMILSVILKESPFFENPERFAYVGIALSLLQQNKKAPAGFDKVEYAILFELKLILDGFFQQLHFLNIREDVKERLAP